MVFTAPAVHYSALATQPPELCLSKSQQSIKHTANGRYRLSRIFKRLLDHDSHAEHTVTTEIEEHVQLPGRAFVSPESVVQEDSNDAPSAIKSLNYNDSDNRAGTEQGLRRPVPSLMESQERLPFTEPYCKMPVPAHSEKLPHLELSAYHKHCIHQEKYIEQKEYHHRLSPVKQPKPSMVKLDTMRPIQEHDIDSSHDHSQIMIDQQCSSLENCIGLQYAVRKSSHHTIRSPYAQRRLHSKAKTRPHSNVPKSASPPKSFTPSPISSSIAHRIELLKQAMQNNEPEGYQRRPAKTCLNEALSSSSIDAIHQQTQTSGHQSQPSEIHHIHHHHIHSSPLLSLEWRTGLSIIGTLLVLFLLLAEFTTINC